MQVCFLLSTFSICGGVRGNMGPQCTVGIRNVQCTKAVYYVQSYESSYEERGEQAKITSRAKD
jgi:hypothetical protein